MRLHQLAKHALITALALASSPPALAQTAPVSGIDRAGFDTSVRPQDDFFEHVNGAWVRDTAMPPDRARWGTFIMLRDRAQEDLRALIETVSAEKDAATGTASQKIRDFYNAYMDVARADELGLTPLSADLDAIRAARAHEDIARLFGALARYRVTTPVNAWIFSDSKDPDTNVVFLGQSGLTLPDRDYYLGDDERFIRARRLMLDYVAAVLERAGLDKPAQSAEAILALETRLAWAHWTRERNRDRVARYNPASLPELQGLAPEYPWRASFEAARLPLRERYIVSQPSYFEAMADLFTETDVSVWRAYLLFQTIDHFAPVLDRDLCELNFRFHRAGLQGIEAPEPRWKRAVNAINEDLGQLLGPLYVARHFTPESKRRMDGLVSHLIRAYERSIRELDWMGEETRREALAKLAKFRPKIAYPGRWRDYSALEVVPGDLVGNVKRAAEFEYFRNVDKLDRAVDRDEWFMTPQTVNAYYNPTWNEIVFPAAILQPPFFNVDADDAVNYGAIGAIIGHEIGHGFDDQGRRSDGDGNLRDWWTEEDSARFLERKEKLVAQYDAYEVIDGLTVNGEFTSGENIGDLGGLAIAHLAWRMSLNGEEAPVIDGWTGDQRFFLGWARIWRAKARPEEARRLLAVDPHAPPKFRTNGTVVNVAAFYEAFGVEPGDGMYLPPGDRVRVW